MNESDYIAVHDLAQIRSAIALLREVVPSSTASVLSQVGPLKGEVDVEAFVASWRDAVEAIYNVQRSLEENVSARTSSDDCVVCGSELLPREVGPPHCETCVVPDDYEEAP